MTGAVYRFDLQSKETVEAAWTAEREMEQALRELERVALRASLVLMNRYIERGQEHPSDA